ncbi:hypothetical protein BTVI_42991 [Pitangus sulphuratus]|nr:hypothetical protein BTVI_42991 [Pitangus sulphuratus]
MCLRVSSNSVRFGAVSTFPGSLLQCPTPLGEEPLSNILPKPLLTQLQAISSGPVTGQHREEISVYPSVVGGLWLDASKTVCPQDNWPPELVDRDRRPNNPPVIQEETVSDLLNHLDPHKSMGPDGIHPKVMRDPAEELAKPLSIICQQSWLTGKVPDDWKLANITLIHKKGCKEDTVNSRPVSLTSVPGKNFVSVPTRDE